MFGFLNINKPSGMTSHDVISFLRKKLKIKQIGHAGTLDPLAYGVLPIAVGKATRVLEYLDEDKIYVVKIQFGKVSDTYDLEGKVIDFSDKKITLEDLKENIKSFIGEIEQIPPVYSAVHYNGKRLYELARKGITPEDIPKRTVQVDFINIQDFDEDKQTADLEIACSKGTYIRSIVHDLGQSLCVGAIMIGLIRVKSGGFKLDKSLNIDETLTFDQLQEKLINPFDVLSYTRKILSEDEFLVIKNGGEIANTKKVIDSIIFLEYNEKLVGIAEVKDDFIRVKKVLV